MIRILRLGLGLGLGMAPVAGQEPEVEVVEPRIAAPAIVELRLAEPEAGAGEAAAAEADRWNIGLDFALTAASGNEEITVLTSGLKIVHLLRQDYELELGTNFRYGRSNGEEVARNLRASLKFDFRPEADFSPFIFVSAERDPFRKLDLRANGGAGGKYRLWRGEQSQEVTLSVGALYSYEDYRLDPLATISPFAREARASWRFSALKGIGEDITLENASFYQPVWDRYGDYLLSSETTARMLVNEWVALSFGYTFERDSTPLEEVVRDDQLLRAGVTLQW